MASSRRLPTSYNESTYGSGQDYTVLATWEAATDNDLVSAENGEVLTVYSGLYDDTIEMEGTPTDSDYFRVVRAADGHKGSKYDGARFVVDASGTNYVFKIAENYSSVHDLAISAGSSADHAACVLLNNSANYAKAIGIYAFDTDSPIAAGIWSIGDNSVICNCVADNITGAAASRAGGFVASGQTNSPEIAFYNNTAIGCQYGIHLETNAVNRAVTANTVNLILQDCTKATYTEGLGTETLNQTTNVTSGVVFKGDNIHLHYSDTAAKGEGTDLSSDATFSFSDDFDGETRSAWDVGADEYSRDYPVYSVDKNFSITPVEATIFDAATGEVTFAVAGIYDIKAVVFVLSDPSEDEGIFSIGASDGTTSGSVSNIVYNDYAIPPESLYSNTSRSQATGPVLKIRRRDANSNNLDIDDYGYLAITEFESDHITCTFHKDDDETIGAMQVTCFLISGVDLEAKVGIIDGGTGTEGVSCGFEPDVVFNLGGNEVFENRDHGGYANPCLGFCTNYDATVTQVHSSPQQLGGTLVGADEECNIRVSDALFHYNNNPDEGKVYTATLANFDSDGFDVVRGGDDGSTDDGFMFLALKVNRPVQCGIMSTPTSTGNHAINSSSLTPSVTFLPDYIFALPNKQTAVNTLSEDTALGEVGGLLFGSSVESSDRCFGYSTENGADPTVSESFDSAQLIDIVDGDGSDLIVGTLTSFDVGEININITTADTTSRKWPFLIIGNYAQNYTRGESGTLLDDDGDLDANYTDDDYADIEADDGDRVAQAVVSGYAIHQFKDYVGTDTRADLTWNGQTNLAPSSSTVYLQAYNQTNEEWDTIDSDSTSSADTDFTLDGSKINLTNYKDANNLMSCRIYQNGTLTLSTDYWDNTANSYTYPYVIWYT